MNNIKACFECGSSIDIHMHHVVPNTKGGTGLIPLCSDCHSLVHDSTMNISSLTRIGLMRKQLHVFARIFYLIVFEELYIEGICQDGPLLFFMPEGKGKRITKVRRIINRMKKIDSNDLIVLFEEISGPLSDNRVFTKAAVLEGWEYFKEQTSMDYRNRSHFIK